MDFADLSPGIAATLASTGIIALAAFMMPGVRWSRQLAREVSILAGLPEGSERTAWEQRVEEHARRLRLFQDLIPRWNKIFSWVPVVLFVFLVVWAILDPRQIDGLVAESPIMIPFVLIALLSTGSFLMTAVLGLRTDGKSGEDIARERGIPVSSRSTHPATGWRGASRSIPSTARRLPNPARRR